MRIAGLDRRAFLGRGALLVVFLATIVVLIYVSTWLVLSAVTESFEKELGLRLTTVAQSAITSATPELLLDPSLPEDTFVRGTLQEIALRHGLDQVFVLDAEGRTRFDLAEDSIGRRNALVDLDPGAFERALAGSPAVSRSIDVDGVVLKSAYAPVEAWNGETQAVLGVAAGADFLVPVRALRRTLVGVGAGSALLAALLGAFYFGMTRRLARAEKALARSETLATMGMMAAGVAHEIRNPLAIIAATA
jgi:signal transduction histidine kinase